MQKNRVLPALLALCLALSLVCSPAHAAEGGQEEPGEVQTAENIPVSEEKSAGGGGVLLAQELEEGAVEALRMAAMAAAETGTPSLATVQTFPGGNYTAERYYITTNSDNQYGLSVAITASTVNEPVLVLTVPKGLTVLYYPTERDVTLAPSLAASNAVSKVTGPDGETVLTYRFKANVASIGFNINLRPTYLLPHNADISVHTGYYAGNALLAEELSTIHTYNPAIADNCVYPYFSYNNNQYNNLLTSRYAAFLPILYFNYSNHYPYDNVCMVVPLPNGAVPGFDEGEDFAAMEHGAAYPITDSYGGYTVTYHKAYPFLDKSGLELGAGQALAFELAPGNKFLTTSGGYYFFNANLFLDFNGLEAGTYNKGIGARVVVTVDMAPMEKTPHAKTTATGSTMNFTLHPYTLSDYLCWGRYYTTSSYGSSNAILPLEDNHYLYNTLYNRTGEVLTNVRIRYTMDSKLYTGRATFNLYENHSFYPSRAQVEYRTVKGGDTVFSATLSSYDKTLVLADKTDAITELTVTYDRLGTNSNNEITLCQPYLCNREGLEETAERRLEMQMLSATSPTHGFFESGWTPAYYQVYVKSRYLGYSSTPWISNTSLNKGYEFFVGFSGGSSMRMQGASFYIVMPPEYIYVRHTVDGQQSKNYAVTTRTLPDGNILYTVKATDDTDHGYENHYLYFKVGPAVDTAVVHLETLPRAFLLENHHPMFPFDLTNSYYSAIDTWDCNQDGSTTDLLAKPYALPTVQINSVNTLYTQGFLTTDVQDGSALTQPYRYDSTGVYRFHVFNGFQSSVEPKDLVVTIAIPSKGAAFSYKDSTYTSQWSGRLTGPATLEGNYWTGAAVTYSTDGGGTYTNHPASWEAVTHIRVEAQAGRALPQSASAVVSLPFQVDFPPDVTTSSRAYLVSSLDYTLTGTVYKRETAITEPCTMTTATTDISGTVFRDYNANGIQDTNEKDVGKAYTVRIYGGDTAEGNILASAASNSTTGAYRLGVLLPGRYTAKVIKGNDEYYNTVGSRFDKNGCYSFTIGGGDEMDGLNLGIISPRTLLLAYSSYNLKSDTPIKLGYTLTPDLLAGEEMTFSSSNPAIVTVSADGKLTYAGDGTATVTITAPQLPAVIAQGGAQTLSKTVSVSTQYAGCRVTAAPTIDKGSAASPVTVDTFFTLDPDGVTATYFYRYNRGGYCNDASHSAPNAVKWSVSGVGATVTAKGDQATVKLTQAGTFVLTATEVWNHAADRRPEASAVTITVPRTKVTKPVPTIGAYLYDGSIQTVDVLESPFYTVSGNQAVDAGEHTITVALKDTVNYEWADSSTEPLTYLWSIGKASVEKPTATGAYVYRAVPQKLVITSSNLYTIVGDTATDAGSYRATVTLKDSKNYLWADGASAPLSFDWAISRAPVSVPTVSEIPAYTGNPITAPIPRSSLYAPSEDTAVGAGSHTAVLTLTDAKNYTWADGTDEPIRIPWRIARAKVEAPAVSADFTYTGGEQIVPIPESELYTVRGAAATDADSYTTTVSLNDTDNYEWMDGSTADLTYRWRIGVASVPVPTVDTNIIYTGEEQSSGVREDSRYMVTGGTAINAGSYIASVALKDTHNYQWTDGSTEPHTLVWSIQKKELTEEMVSLTKEKTYTGRPITLGDDEVAVRDGTALNAEDWQVAGYTDNVAVGAATVTIEATESGNYCGQVQRQFAIRPKACDGEFSVGEIQPQLYTGKEINPEPAVSWGGETLVQGIDYTLSYRDNVEPGDSAKVIVTFTGNFTGVLETVFTIYQPSTPTYAIKVICGQDGKVTPGSVRMSWGESKTFSIQPDLGYELAALLVDGKAVELADQYTFRSVKTSHTLEARFAPAGLPYYLMDGRRVFIGFAAEGRFIAPEGAEVLFTRDTHVFQDTASSPYSEDIQFVTDRELFIGTQPGRFAPNQYMDRGMTATVLGRLYERSFGPLSSTGLTFDDVIADDKMQENAGEKM